MTPEEEFQQKLKYISDLKNGVSGLKEEVKAQFSSLRDQAGVQPEAMAQPESSEKPKPRRQKTQSVVDVPIQPLNSTVENPNSTVEKPPEAKPGIPDWNAFARPRVPPLQRTRYLVGLEVVSIAATFFVAAWAGSPRGLNIEALRYVTSPLIGFPLLGVLLTLPAKKEFVAQFSIGYILSLFAYSLISGGR